MEVGKLLYLYPSDIVRLLKGEVMVMLPRRETIEREGPGLMVKYEADGTGLDELMASIKSVFEFHDTNAVPAVPQRTDLFGEVRRDLSALSETMNGTVAGDVYKVLANGPLTVVEIVAKIKPKKLRSTIDYALKKSSAKRYFSFNEKTKEWMIA